MLFWHEQEYIIMISIMGMVEDEEFGTEKSRITNIKLKNCETLTIGIFMC